MQTIYIEKSIKNHPRVEKIVQRVGREALIIECENYRQVFNPKSQNFRLQKQQPALILAKKTGRLVVPTPEGFGIGGENNYYFSHMLNCIYDCRYCFLQGMYPSAHYVVFINYEDFMSEINQVLNQHPSQIVYFFSGYDGDSLAFDNISGFVDNFLPFFSNHPKALLELRTKSTQINSLLEQPVLTNCIVAFSFTPEKISKKVEHKVPPLKKRLYAMQKLADAGWQIGLRFDPLIYDPDFRDQYQELLKDIFLLISPEKIHSVSVGPLRFPQKMYQEIVQLYPHDQLLAQPLLKRGQQISYPESIEIEMKQTVLKILQNYLPKTLLFECNAL